MKRFVALFVAVLAILSGLSVYAQDGRNVGATRVFASGKTSIASGTPAVIVSAVSGKVIRVRIIPHLVSSAAGTVTFYDGATTTTHIASFECIAGSSVPIGQKWTEQDLGPGFATTAGNALCAQLNGANLTYDLVVEEY
jgi:hypothetical protein